MAQGEIELAFDRWRSQGDLQALGRVIDLASPELLSIAARLAPDVAEAEDLVQAVFLALIEKPRAWDARKPLVPWLVGILANQARKSARAAGRRVDEARLLEKTAAEPPRIAVEEEASSAVRRALDGLPPLYREVVTRSVLEGERPLDIARTLDRAPGTVRMQLLRGLELLRRALPAGLAGGGALVLVGTRGEAALRTRVLERAAELPLAGPAAPLASLSLLGGLLVSTKLLIAPAVIAVALGTWLVWPDDRLEDPDARTTAGPSSSTGTAALEAGELASSTTEVGRALAGETAAPAPGPAASAREGWWLVGSVRGARVEDLPEVEVHVSVDNGGSRVVSVRDDGTFEVELSSLLARPRISFGLAAIDVGPPPLALPSPFGAVRVAARHPDYLSEVASIPGDSVEPQRSAGGRIEVRCDPILARAAVVRGIVRCEPEERATVHVVLLGRAEGTEFFIETLSETEIEPGAEFRLRAPRSGTYVVQASCAAFAPAAARVKLETGRELEVPVLVLERSTVAIEGRVDLPDAFDLAKLELHAHFEAPASPETVELPTIGFANRATFREVRGGAVFRAQSTRIAPDGAFRIEGLAPGKWRIDIGGLPSTLPGVKQMFVDAPSRNVVLGAHLGVVRIFVESGGKPVPRALTTWSTDSETGSTHVSQNVDGKGRLAVLVDRDVDYAVSASVDTGERAGSDLPAAGRPRALDVVLELPELDAPGIIELLPPAGARAPEKLGVLLRERGDTTLTESERGEGRLYTLTGELAGDRYRVDEVPAGRWAVEIGPNTLEGPVAFFGSFVQSERFDLELAPGGRVERRVALRAGGRLRVRTLGVPDEGAIAKWTVTDAGGRRVEGPFVSQLIADGRATYREDPVHLSLHLDSALEPCLEPGRYTLAIDSPAWQAAPIAFEIQAGRTTEVELPLWAK